MTVDTSTREKEINRVTLVGFVVNLILSAAKLAAGILGRSGAMVADAIHSFSDMATDIVVIVFARISSKPKDDGHDYGHGKYETLATIIISLALAAVGIGILSSSIGSIRTILEGGTLPRPGAVALVAAVVSIVAKEILYRYTVRVGRRIDSPSVIANAWHHRSDALSSLGTLAGIGCAYFLGEKWRIADPIAALLVAVFIFKIALDLIRTGLGELLEKSLPADVEQEILSIVTANPEIRSPHNLRTRRIGASIAIEVHVRVDGAMSVAHSHALTVDIEHRLRARFGAGTRQQRRTPAPPRDAPPPREGSPARQHLRDGSSARRDLRSTGPPLDGPTRPRTTAFPHDSTPFAGTSRRPHENPHDGPTKTRTTAPRTWHGVWVFTAREESFLRRRQSDEKRKKFGFSEKNTYLATQNVCRTPVSERAKAHKDKTINTKKDCLSEENSTLSN